MQNDERQADGLVLVRRFTDDLAGETTLERAAISAQQQQDGAEEALRRRRMEALYREPNRDPNDFAFHEMETARLMLEKARKQVESVGKPSKLDFNRKSARSTANEAVTNSFVHDFQGLKTVVEGFESDWKGGQKQVGRRFRRVCQKLDDNKAAFAIFPSQDLYTSALCGSLAWLVSAAVNHNDIAEKLSEMVADIADKATRAARYVMIYRTNSFRELFSDLYAQVFRFYRDAIEWYAKSKLARALDSFNASLVKSYEKATARIETLLREIYREAQVAGSAQWTVFLEDAEAGRRGQRAQYTDQDDLIFAGREAQRLMMMMHRSMQIEDAPSYDCRSQNAEIADGEIPPMSIAGLLDRQDARRSIERLKTFVVGSEGSSLFRDGRLWLPETKISAKLGDWMSPDTEISTLWATCPAESSGFPGSRAAALSTVVMAWKSGLPIISHFCARPYSGDLVEGRTVEQVGMIGLVYNLIIQLLEFNVEDDALQVSEKVLEKLDGSDESWSGGLLLLRDLLRTTPEVQRCVIDGLNDLCSSSGAEWGDAFLQMLFEHQKTSVFSFKILLTTSGQSRVLPRYIESRNKVSVAERARQTIRNGEWLEAPQR